MLTAVELTEQLIILHWWWNVIGTNIKISVYLSKSKLQDLLILPWICKQTNRKNLYICDHKGICKDIYRRVIENIFKLKWCTSVQFSRLVISNSLPLCGLHHARHSCPSPTPQASSNLCPSSWWCHPTISSSVIPFFSCLQSFPSSAFSKESVLHIRWPNYWNFSFSISPSSEYSVLISFRIDWFDVFAVEGTLKSLLQHYSSKTPNFWRSTFFMVQLSHP